MPFVPFYSWIQQQNNGVSYNSCGDNKRGRSTTATATMAHPWEIDGSSRRSLERLYQHTEQYCLTSTRRSTSSMVSALRRQVGSLCVRGPFLCPADIEMRDGWHMLRMDDILFELNSTLSGLVLIHVSLCRPRKEEMVVETRKAVDTLPSSAARTARAQSRRIRLSNDSR